MEKHLRIGRMDDPLGANPSHGDPQRTLQFCKVRWMSCRSPQGWLSYRSLHETHHPTRLHDPVYQGQWIADLAPLEYSQLPISDCL